MGGFVRKIISPGEKRRKRAKRQAEAANLERKKKRDKQKAEEALVAQSRGKRRVKAAGRRRRVFTSPLGITDNGTDTLA